MDESVRIRSGRTICGPADVDIWGVAACDIDQDGFEEIYFLNNDTYSGEKKYSDRLIDNSSNGFIDLFEKDINKKNLNLTAGRSVVCVDRNGDGKYGIYVANYGAHHQSFQELLPQVLVSLLL